MKKVMAKQKKTRCNALRVVTISATLAFIGLWVLVSPVFAIDLPDSHPSIQQVYIWRNAIEPNDMVVIIEENTPYGTPPTTTEYNNAFIWHFIDDDGVTELGQALSYDYNESGYGYNVIGFYFSASDNVTWGLNYFLKLTGTPSAFTTPPEYTFPVVSTYYSALTDTDEVKADIAAKIILLATDLNNKWGLTTSYFLTTETQTTTVLSLYGESFFRGALYGVQSYAPAAFEMNINNLTALTDRVWTEAYSANLSVQHALNYIGVGIQAGKEFFGVDYNLAGMLGTLAIVCGVIVGGLVLSGDWWGASMNGVPPLIIMARMGMFGLGELGLIAAMGWLFVSAKIWKVI